MSAPWHSIVSIVHSHSLLRVLLWSWLADPQCLNKLVDKWNISCLYIHCLQYFSTFSIAWTWNFLASFKSEYEPHGYPPYAHTTSPVAILSPISYLKPGPFSLWVYHRGESGDCSFIERPCHNWNKKIDSWFRSFESPFKINLDIRRISII